MATTSLKLLLAQWHELLRELSRPQTREDRLPALPAPGGGTINVPALAKAADGRRKEKRRMSNAHDGLNMEWEDLLAAARQYEEEVPALTTFKNALERVLESVNVSKAHQLNLEARRQQATLDYHRQVAAGRELVSRLKCLAKAVFGRHDSRLSDFGIKPSGRPGSRKPPDPETIDGSHGCN
jgi:hypothetical protein